MIAHGIATNLIGRTCRLVTDVDGQAPGLVGKTFEIAALYRHPGYFQGYPHMRLLLRCREADKGIRGRLVEAEPKDVEVLNG